MSENVWIAFIGFSGAIIGSLATLAGTWLSHYLQQQAAAEKERARKDLLLALLNDDAHDWRELETLQHVIGADEATTKRLLIDIGARASENGKPIWALISKQPLPRKR
ncbi:hypothetical protein SAMN05192553_101719 [Cyclobacterium xiamenense]|uniref:Uncharacterized protein n=1 Tax=Cyclobacterium xiamenense TaxID=1297121 RepID=A0A1H6U9I2_9BACT|nr:hypothetical protein [Cyclobacterium xiamenense]SEI89019.1 hypothetical protein SAMN05192553_101719 [Cyclobacterium xiamenense]